MTDFALDKPRTALLIAEDCCVDSDVEVHDFLMCKIFPRQADVVQSADVIQALR